MQKMWARGLWIIRTSLEKSPQSMAGSSNTLGMSDPPRPVQVASSWCWKESAAHGCYQWQWEGGLMLWSLRESQWWRWARSKKEHLPQRSAGARASGCQGATVEPSKVEGSVGAMQRWAWRKFYHCKPGMTKETKGYGCLPISIDQWLKTMLPSVFHEEPCVNTPTPLPFSLHCDRDEESYSPVQPSTLIKHIHLGLQEVC